MEHVSNSPALNSRGKAQNARVRPMQKRQGPLDFALLITVVIICAFGLVMVFSSQLLLRAEQEHGQRFLLP